MLSSISELLKTLVYILNFQKSIYMRITNWFNIISWNHHNYKRDRLTETAWIIQIKVLNAGYNMSFIQGYFSTQLVWIQETIRFPLTLYIVKIISMLTILGKELHIHKYIIQSKLFFNTNNSLKNMYYKFLGFKATVCHTKIALPFARQEYLYLHLYKQFFCWFIFLNLVFVCICFCWVPHSDKKVITYTIWCVRYE